jgi:hypothetical protein
MALGDRLTTGLSLRTGGDVRFVDISEKPKQANIIRAGKQVPYLALDKSRLADFINVGDLVTPSAAARVVSQSVEPGTKVPRGTVVNLVLAARSVVPVELIPGAHRGFAERTMDDLVVNFLTDRAVSDVVLNFEQPEDVPEAQRQAMEAQLATRDIPIDPADSERDFGAAFRTLRGAAAFR